MSAPQKKLLIRKKLENTKQIKLFEKKEQQLQPQLSVEQMPIVDMDGTKDEIIKQDITFTRYYYVKQAVFVSLWISILDKQLDESLFWAFELYYSGLENELLEFLMFVYYDFFHVYNSKEFEELLMSESNKWIETKDVSIIGNMIANFVCRPYTIIQFLKKLYSTKEEYENIDFGKYFEKDVPFYVKMQSSAFDKYKTQELDDNVHILQKYKIRSNEYNLMQRTVENVVVLEEVYENWNAYLSISKIWDTRIKYLNGMLVNFSPTKWNLEIVNWTNEQKEYVGILTNPCVYGWQDFYNDYYIKTSQRINDVSICLNKLP